MSVLYSYLSATSGSTFVARRASQTSHWPSDQFDPAPIEGSVDNLVATPNQSIVRK